MKNFNILLLASIGLVASGCQGLSKSGGASTAATKTGGATSAVSGNAVTAFSTSLYAITSVSCLPCHGSSGSQPQKFADSNVNTAYAATKQAIYVNFNSPTASGIYQKISGGHQGIATSLAGNIAGAINTWATTELAVSTSSSSSSGGSSSSSSGPGTVVTPTLKYRTAPLSIPAGLPSATTFVPMRWMLTNLIPANSDLNGAVFEIEAQLLNSTTYRFRNPKLISPNTGMTVKGVHLMIRKASDAGNGSEDPFGVAWTGVNLTVAQMAVPNPLPATPIVGAANLSATANIVSIQGSYTAVVANNDVITIGFEDLVRGAGAACRNLNGTNGFVTNVKPILVASCQGCHTNVAAYKLVAGNDATNCLTTLNEINVTTPDSSKLLVKGQGGMGHAGGAPLTAAGAATWKLWIMTE